MKIFRTLLCTLCQNCLSHSICNYVASTALMVQWRHISSESAVPIMFQLLLIFVAKRDAQSKAWDILLVLTSVAGNLCNKCPNSYSNKTAVKVILSKRSLVSIEQQSPRRPCDILVANVGPEVAKTAKTAKIAKCVKKCAKLKMFKTALSGLANKVPVEECARVFCVCQSVVPVSPGLFRPRGLAQLCPAFSS